MRLLQALGSVDFDARMLVVQKNTTSLRVDTAAGRRRSRMAFLAEHADIYLHNGRNRDTLFKISTARYGLPLHKHPWVKDSDIIILNWVNQGMLSLDGIRRLAAVGKPLIWTMHDQWNMTGVCHYTAACEAWRTGCGNCPLLGKAAKVGDISSQTFSRKKSLYGTVPIRFVAVSRRLAQLCAQSPLMTDAEITVIPNAFPVGDFKTVPTLTRRELGLPDPSKRLVVMGAARLDDPVKNLPTAVAALNGISTPDVAAVFFGEIRNPNILTGLRIPYVHLGSIADSRRLAQIMAHADVVLSTSVWETLPGTTVEGIAAGAVAVAGTNGGQSDIVDPGVTGYLVDSDDAAAYTAAIDRALTLPQTAAARDSRHRDIAARFGADKVAAAYSRLILDTINRTNG